MGLKIDDLVAMPHLQTKWFAGELGGGRIVQWAHGCEIASPWEFLGQGDLLMTSGIAIPSEASEQATFIARLDEAGLAGIAIGQDMHAPPLTSAFRDEAEARAFPVLETAYHVPFAAVGRAIAQASQDLEHRRLVTTMRIYDAVRVATIRGKAPGDCIPALGEELRCHLHVVDARGIDIFRRSRADSTPALQHAVERLVEERQRQLPAILRLDVGADAAAMVPVPSRRFAALVAVAKSRGLPDLTALQHAAAVAAFEVERLSARREEQRRAGVELFAALLAGAIDVVLADERLKGHGLSGEGLVVVAVRQGSSEYADLHHRLSDSGTPHLVLTRESVLLVLIHDGDESLAALRSSLGEEERHAIGVSGPFTGARGASDAAREAMWALSSAGDQDGVVRYGDAAPLFLPRSVTEARTAVDRVLGKLLAYDSETGSELVSSLRIFLSCNRSWQRACTELHVHKQTLVYRMSRVEQLTGRSLRDMGDVAELWLALQALEALERGSTDS